MDPSAITTFPSMGSTSLTGLLMRPATGQMPVSLSHLGASAPGFVTRPGPVGVSADDLSALEPSLRNVRGRTTSSMSNYHGSNQSLPSFSRNLRRSPRSTSVMDDIDRTTLINCTTKRSRTNTSSPAISNPAKKARTEETKIESIHVATSTKSDIILEETSDPSCCICMGHPEAGELSSIDGCNHQFCFGCISKWADRENTCPLCKVRFQKIARVNPIKRKKGAPPNTKKVKQRDQRSDIISGSALEGLLASLTASRQISRTQMRNFFVSRMAGLEAFAPLPSRHLNDRFTFSLEDAFFADSDDEDNYEEFHNPLTHNLSPAGYRIPYPAAHILRSLAVNNHDGSGSNSNPIELTDSDDEDDDIEVIQVSRST